MIALGRGAYPNGSASTIAPAIAVEALAIVHPMRRKAVGGGASAAIASATPKTE